MPAPAYYGNVEADGRPWFDVTYFGAKGDGVTDDSAAILLALAAANAQPGGVLFFPRTGASFLYNQTANGPLLLTATLLVMLGLGAASQITFTGASGDCIQQGGVSSQYQTISGLSLTALNLSGAGYVVNTIAGNHNRIDNCVVTTTGNGVGNTCPTGGVCFDYAVDNTVIVLSGSASIGLDLQTGTSFLRFNNLRLYGPTVIGGTSIGIRFPTSKVQDTVIMSQFIVNGFNQGLVIGATSGAGMGDWHFSNGIISQHNVAALFIGGTRGINRVQFENCWFDAANFLTPNAVAAAVSGPVYDLDFNQCRFNTGSVATGAVGFYIQSGASGGPLRLSNCSFEGNSNYGLSVGADIVLEVTGGMAMQNLIAALALGSSAGWVNRKTFTGFDAAMASNGAAFATASALNTYGSTVIIRNCPGITPALSQAPPAVPATTVAIQNTFPYDMTVYVTGGASTVTVAIGATAGGTTTAAVLPANAVGSFFVPAGQWVKLTYANAPTWAWFAN